ncbi:L-rhamnose mutarotase [Pedobacter frigoris]|uniref:L-rhamnose mutarotase n=1 Tax=Pedobacter frigoris TaxID=2571272 RepID=UPI00292D8ACA|nr:L-rhamnose mutarotase [Pedobacter frigoris]
MNRRNYYSLWILCSLAGLFLSCQKPVDHEKTKDLVFVVNLVDDEQKVKEYLAYHQKVWPEVEAGFKKAGYRKIKLYRFNRSVVMVITVPENADLNRMGQIAEAYDKKCKEWNQRMDAYQIGVDGVADGQKWAQTEQIYSFINP